MKRPRIFVVRPSTLALGTLLQTAVAVPVMAATFPTIMLPSTVTPYDALLYGSVMLLAIGIALRLIKRRDDNEPAQNAPDLRWWKNVES